MKNARSNEVSDRRGASAEAKAALLNAYREAKIAAEPLRVARQAERSSVALAREERRVERERVKHDEQSRVETEAADRQLKAEAADKARIARVIEDEAKRKAERDRRYANRKARQG
jgi:hypothetical protein